MKLSILIPFRDRPELLNRLLSSLEKFPFTLGEWETILIDNGSSTEALAKIIRPASLLISEFRCDEPFNFQRLNNLGAERAQGDVLLLLNNDTEMLEEKFLDRLYEKSLDPMIGAVGALLLYGDNSIQHGGVVVGLKRYAEHLYRGMKLSARFSEDVPPPTHDRPITAVTAACLAVEKRKFDAVGGMDEEFIVCGGDVDLCLRLRAAGFNNYYLGSIKALHHESKSRKGQKIPYTDFAKSEESYSRHLEGQPDPYYPDFLSRSSFKPQRRPLAHGKIGSLGQDLKERFMRVKNLVQHGGLSRAFQVLQERHVLGYSTRALTYSWPKRFLFEEDLLQPRRRHYFLPHLLSSQTFGGIATILEHAVKDAQQGEFVHFVLFDAGGDFENIKKSTRLNDEEWEKIAHRFSASRFDSSLDIEFKISPYDTFVATAWWTKLSLDASGIDRKKITYLIQDYEPLFYDDSDPIEAELRQLAKKSYEDVNRALINSHFLAEFLFANKILKEWELDSFEVFEPAVDPAVFFEDSSIDKRRQVFVYARPEVARNRFDLCVEALKIIAPQIPPDWEIFGLGTLKKDVDLGSGQRLIAKGKMPFDAYIRFLKETPLSLCLMESPHPSYPPLEAASCGSLVVCNRYANKDYATLGRRYLSCDLSAADLAQKLLLGLQIIDSALPKAQPPAAPLPSQGQDLIL